MTNPAKAKGSLFEREVVKRFRYWGHRHVERAYGAGRQDDRGDLVGLLGGAVVVECKAQKTFNFSAWLAEAEVERVNAGAAWGVVVAKRGRRPIGESYVVMTLDDFAELLAVTDV
jgi:Holliday junction resolvase